MPILWALKKSKKCKSLKTPDLTPNSEEFTNFFEQ